MIDNTTVESTVKLDAEDALTIDLNGKSLEAPNGTAFNMSNGGELTLVNGTVNSKTFAVYAGQNAVIHELNIDMNAGDWGVYLKDTAVLEKGNRRYLQVQSCEHGQLPVVCWLKRDN